uniref:Ras-related protein Rab-18 n=1 Tax=Heterorhabditis bacteriophora TaxID=37862 RepID=A0A1I7X9C6_HETBA
MCGDAAVGKSSLVLRLISGKHANNLPSTLGIDFHVKTVGIDGRNVALQFRSLCKSYFRRADGAILVYDVTAERSFLRIREWIDTINESVERHIPVVLVGNKTDLRLREDEGIPTKDGSALAAVSSFNIFLMDGSNVETTILTLAREMMAVEDVEVRAAGVILSPRTRHSAGCFSKCSKS